MSLVNNNNTKVSHHKLFASLEMAIQNESNSNMNHLKNE